MSYNPTPFTIRPYQPADAPQLVRVFFESVRQLGERRYSPEQVKAWAPAPADPAAVHARACDGRITLVALGSNGTVVAYGDLEVDGHIDHLYCSPEAAGRGVAAAIVDALLSQALATGLTRLYVEASEIARGLFERKGFVVLHRRDFLVRGVPIHNYAMERSVR